MKSVPKRILLLAESPYLGGINSHLISIVEAFHGRDDFEIVLACMSGRREDVSLFDAARDRGIEVVEIPMHSRFYFRALETIRDVVKERDIGVIHTHNYRATIAAWGTHPRVPIVNTCHGQIVAPSLALRMWQGAELRVMRRLERTIACSEFVKAWLVAKGLPEHRVTTVYNAYEPRGVTVRDVRMELGIDSGEYVVMYAGRLAEGKGLDDLLRAASKTQPVTILFAGDGPLRRELEARANSLSLRAYFVGVARDMTNYYRACDVVVLPSEMEALPMTLIEALAHERAVIATNVGGVPEVVSDETGALVPPRDSARLAAAINRLRDPAVRTAYAAKGHTRWQSRFRQVHLADALAEVYRDAIK